MRLSGDNGSATLWPFRIYYKENDVLVSKTPDLINTSSENQFSHFVKCIIYNRQPIATIEQGVTIIRMLDAAYRSAMERKSVSL